MTSLRRYASGFQTGGASPHHQNGLGVVGFRETIAAPQILMPCRRVDQARYVIVTPPPSPALLIAGQTAANILDPILSGLGDQMRVRDLTAHDRDKIGLPTP